MPRLNIRRVKGAGKSQGQGKKKKTALLQDVVDPDEGLVLLAEAPDFLGHGETLARRTSHFVRKASSAYGMPRGARSAVHGVGARSEATRSVLHKALTTTVPRTTLPLARLRPSAQSKRRLRARPSTLCSSLSISQSSPSRCFWSWRARPFMNITVPSSPP
jgi:hypothetical protein